MEVISALCADLLKKNTSMLPKLDCMYKNQDKGLVLRKMFQNRDQLQTASTAEMVLASFILSLQSSL